MTNPIGPAEGEALRRLIEKWRNLAANSEARGGTSTRLCADELEAALGDNQCSSAPGAGVRELAQELVDRYMKPHPIAERHGGCGWCGGLPHSVNCLVGRMEAALAPLSGPVDGLTCPKHGVFDARCETCPFCLQEQSLKRLAGPVDASREPALAQQDYAVIAEAVDDFLGFDITTREQQDRITRWAKAAAVPSSPAQEEKSVTIRVLKGLPQIDCLRCEGTGIPLDNEESTCGCLHVADEYEAWANELEATLAPLFGPKKEHDDEDDSRVGRHG